MSNPARAPIDRIFGESHDYWGEVPTLEDAPDDVVVDEDDRRRRRKLAEELSEEDVWVDTPGVR